MYNLVLLVYGPKKSMISTLGVKSLTLILLHQPIPTPIEAGSLRCEIEDFTKSQSVEGKEYVPSMQFPKTTREEV